MNGKDLITLVEYMNSSKAPKAKKMKTETDFVSRLKRINEEKELLEKYLAESKKKEEPRKARQLTFAEGIIIAYVLQFTLPIVVKVVSIQLGLPQ